MTDGPETDFTLTFEQRGDYLYAFVRGLRDNLAVSTKYWARVHLQAVALGVKKILVEEDFPNQLSTADMYEAARFVTTMFGPTVKIAHVDKRALDMDLNNFGEVVGRGRGLDARVFSKIEDAERWLKG